MEYPLTMTFKVLALASQLSVTDAGGALVFYVKQKMFKLKEAVTVFADIEQQRPLYSIKADRILDISAKYRFFDQQGVEVGAVKRRGMKSFWKAHYDILDGDNPVMSIQEENAWIKVMDGVLREIPLLGIFSGYFFNPTYLVTRSDGSLMLRIKKQPSFLSRTFQVTLEGQMDQFEQRRAILSVLMAALLERSRG